MRILVAHNEYQLRGGEDVVFENEVSLLLQAGHDVQTVKVSNNDVVSVRDKVQMLLGTAHNSTGVAAILQAVEAHRPAVAHFHNVFPLLSPAVYRACRNAGVAVVQTLHNFRPICLGTFFLRNGAVCERCTNRSPLPGIVHRCYRNSVVASAAAARMLWVHQRRGTWSTDVDRYIALSGFSRGKFVDAGFPTDRVVVKPNFITDPPGRDPADPPRSGILYVGRLSPEKGVATLIEACSTLEYELRIAGGGPQRQALQAQAGSKVVFLGAIDRACVLAEMRKAAVIVVPSTWFESFPMTIVEAFACGTPVIASRLGSLAEIVEDNVAGLLVTPGDPIALRQSIVSLLSDPYRARTLGQGARRLFVERYGPEVNLPQLEKIYSDAIEERALDYSLAKTG